MGFSLMCVCNIHKLWGYKSHVCCSSHHFTDSSAPNYVSPHAGGPPAISHSFSYITRVTTFLPGRRPCNAKRVRGSQLASSAFLLFLLASWRQLIAFHPSFRSPLPDRMIATPDTSIRQQTLAETMTSSLLFRLPAQTHINRTFLMTQDFNFSCITY